MIYRLLVHVHPQGSSDPILSYALPSYKQAYKMVQSVIITAMSGLCNHDSVTIRWSIHGWSKGRIRELKHGFVYKERRHA